ncbi:MAG: hypothetical protein GY835_16910 [bacterium]|nr:hypothetical protein [bacterium]
MRALLRLIPPLCILFTLSCTQMATETASPSVQLPDSRQALLDYQKANRAERLAWWREARFGMFIHWGLYAVHGGEWEGEQYGGYSEWLVKGIPVDEYEPLVDRFNPVDFDADAWVRLAREAGMRYLVITTKHHEGFSMWDSEVTDFDIMATPFGRDVMAEIAAACRRQGIRIGWYYSVMDWHHPDYLPRREVDERPAATADYQRYVDYMQAQLRELLTGFGEIDIIWFDGDWEHGSGDTRSEEIVEMIYRLQPDAIINNRISLPMDFATPEQQVPVDDLPGRPWETCMTITSSWGYNKGARDWKSAGQLVRNLVDISAKGGNYLLNVGPDESGRIPVESERRLRAVGAWMQTNGEAIRGTQAGPFRSPDLFPWGRCTRKALPNGGTRLYIHVFERPVDNRLLIPELGSLPVQAAPLADPGLRLECSLSERDNLPALEINLDSAPHDSLCTVLALDFESEPVVCHEPRIVASAPILYDSLEVRLESECGALDIRYTADGSEPTATSALYSGPLHLLDSAVISARAFLGGRPILGEVRREFRKQTARPAVRVRRPLPGLNFTYWEGTWQETADFGELPPVAAGVTPVVSLGMATRHEHFALRFAGYIDIPADGVYRFSLNSDDGSTLRIDDELIIDNDGPHGMREKQGAIALARGLHALELNWFDCGGYAGLEFEWGGLESALQPVAEENLFHD